jgi:hypothetical protein
VKNRFQSLPFKCNLQRYITVTNIKTNQFSVWPARGPFNGRDGTFYTHFTLFCKSKDTT